jgi:predicted alpha/beta-fold hydrolase
VAIFANPQDATSDHENDLGVKVLFLHGLEGSPEGDKAVHLKAKWGTNTPMLRTDDLRGLRSKYPGRSWQEMPAKELQKAVDKVYEDVLAAVAYAKPDVIVGSSMGGALLARLILGKKWHGPTVFLAPAIEPLLGNVNLPSLKNSVWILGELDAEVPNSPNVYHCVKSGGSLVLSMGDGHRLHKALTSGLIDCAVITALELEGFVNNF